MRALLAAIALVASIGSAAAQDHMKLIDPDRLVWRQHPLYKKAQITILVGNPQKPEPVVQRVKFPGNFQIPPHFHPYTETITIISGSAGWGMGEKFDKSKGELLKTGGFMLNPAKHPHFMWTGSEGAVLEIHFMGPGGITYINPQDDPRKNN